jgi:hypothetical protein
MGVIGCDRDECELADRRARRAQDLQGQLRRLPSGSPDRADAEQRLPFALTEHDGSIERAQALERARRNRAAGGPRRRGDPEEPFDAVSIHRRTVTEG